MACASLSTGGGEGTAYTFPAVSSSPFLPPALPTSFHPHMSAQVLAKPRIVGSVGTYGAERRRNERWREGRGGEESERERSCQGNVSPCHSSQKSAMDEWITAISDCQAESSVRFDVFWGQSGSHATQCTNHCAYKASLFGPTFTSFPACVWIMYTGVSEMQLDVHRRAGLRTQTRPCSFRAAATGLLSFFVFCFLTIC